MKKIAILITFVSWIFGVDQHCLEVTKKFYDLQNRIILKSFSKLHPGAYAVYSGRGKAIYVGKLRSPHSGEIHHVVEFVSNAPLQEIWYDLEKINARYGNIVYPYWYIHIKEIYAKTKYGLIYIPQEMIDLYIQSRGNDISQILRPPLKGPLPCTRLPILTDIKIKVKNEIIHAVKIQDSYNKSYIIVSEEVPFGMVEDRFSRLIDFGWSGEKARISQKERKLAKPLMSNIPMPPQTIIKERNQ